ncbi:MAG: metallophosphoesterase family protein, partial [Desulfobacteraceae bacterium]
SMRIAVLSDIHGNLEALTEVLADLDRQGVEHTVSLGDNVGYGPESEGVVRVLRRRGIPSVMGNHEWGLMDRANLRWFNPTARAALRRTEELLSEESLTYCRSLPVFMVEEECRFVHGCPPEDVLTYLFQLSEAELRAVLSGLKERVCFVGHTHELLLVTMEGGALSAKRLGPGVCGIKGEGAWLVNAGSVGQPRDKDNRAKYVIWDSDEWTLEARFIEYDIGKTARAIKAVGIPGIYADRLW